MKLAITATGPDLSSGFDPRFGRAKYLLFVDMPLRTFVSFENKAAMDAAQGAGIQAAQNVIDHGAEAVVTGQLRAQGVPRSARRRGPRVSGSGRDRRREPR